MTLIKKSRFVVALNGVLITDAGFSYSIKVSDISASGLSLILETKYLPEIISNKIQENHLSPVSIEVDIDLADVTSKLKVQCGIVYVQRKSFELSVIGCRFERFVDDASERLEKYLLNLDNDPSVKKLKLDH